MGVRTRVPWAIDDRILRIEATQSEAVNRILGRVSEGIPSAKILNLEAGKIVTGTLKAGEGITVGTTSTPGAISGTLLEAGSAITEFEYVTGPVAPTSAGTLLLSIVARHEDSEPEVPEITGLDTEWTLVDSVYYDTVGFQKLLLFSARVTGLESPEALHIEFIELHDSCAWIVSEHGPTLEVTEDDAVVQWATITNTDITSVTAAEEFTAPAGTTPAPRGIDFDGANFWLVQADDYPDDTVYELNPLGGIESSFQLAEINGFGTGDNPRGIIHDGTDLWIMDASDFAFYHVQTDGTLIAAYTPDASVNSMNGDIAWDGSFIWLVDGSSNVIHKIDPADPTNVVSTIPLNVASGGFTYHDGYFWIHETSTDQLHQIDPADGTVIDSWTRFGSFGATTVGLCTDGTWLFATDWNANEVARLFFVVNNVLGTLGDTDNRGYQVTAVKGLTGIRPSSANQVEIGEIGTLDHTLQSQQRQDDGVDVISHIGIQDEVTYGAIAVELRHDESVSNAATIKSSNYVAGVSGWLIEGNGDAEFNNIVARGTIEATAGFLDDLDLTGRLTTNEDVRFGDKVTSGEVDNWHGFSIDPANVTPAANSNIFAKDFDTGRVLFRVNFGGTQSIKFDSTASPPLVVEGKIEATDFRAGDGTDSVSIDPGAWGTDTSQIRLVTGGYPSAGGEELTLTLNGSGPKVTMNLARSGTTAWPIFELGSALLTIGTKAFPFPIEASGILLADGSVGAPALRFSDDPDTGILRTASPGLEFVVSGNRVGLLTSSGLVDFQGAYDNTTGNAANVHVSSQGRLHRSTSSLRYKKDLRPWDHRQSVMDLTPTLYRSALDADDGRQVRLGLIAEEVAEHFPIAAVYNEDGEPEAIDWNMIITGLLAEVKALKERATT